MLFLAFYFIENNLKNMGRFINKLISGAKKVGGFIAKGASTVGKVAGVLSNIPLVGAVASTVARGANLVNKVANGVVNFAGAAEKFTNKHEDTFNKISDAGKAIYNTGIPDKITNGGATRVIGRIKEGMNRAERGYDRTIQRIQNATARG